MIPFWTSGVASSEYLVPIPEPRWVTQAPFNWVTLEVLIWFSVE
jgi:hypothetical protein